jgi:CxxC-x17-CxxC domain-containing protein
MEFCDKTLRCVDCAEEFVFSADEQRFFSMKQFQHEPKRCRRCRAKRENVRRPPETSAICAECGISTVVPFKPRQGRPVLCRACFDRIAVT